MTFNNNILFSGLVNAVKMANKRVNRKDRTNKGKNKNAVLSNRSSQTNDNCCPFVKKALYFDELSKNNQLLIFLFYRHSHCQ